MKIARILYPVKTLGPGERVGIWTCGCKRNCLGCANPELWDTSPYGDVRVSDIVRAIEGLEGQGYGRPEGVTITGGEPFEQKEELRALVEALRGITEDILVYTGFLRDELLDCEETIIGKLAVLVDGAYVREQNLEHPLKGSENQNIHYIREEMRERYESYIEGMRGKRLVQNFKITEGKVCVGIHGRDFAEEYEKRRSAYGGERALHR